MTTFELLVLVLLLQIRADLEERRLWKTVYHILSTVVLVLLTLAALEEGGF